MYNENGCWEQSQNETMWSNNTASSFDECLNMGYTASPNKTLTFNGLYNKSVHEMVSCDAPGTELLVLLWNNATEQDKLNVFLKAENLPNDTSVALAGFINVACNASARCNQEQNDGTGITDYVMGPNETVVVWALCQGVTSWDVNLMITAEFYEPEVASNSLTGGAIAGIVIGSVVGGIFIIAFAYKYLRCKRNKTMSLPQESAREENNERHDTEGKAGDVVDYLPQAQIHPAPKEGMLSIDQDASSSVLGATG